LTYVTLLGIIEFIT